MPISPGTTLPAINLLDAQGTSLTAGKPSVLTFVKSSCPTCALTLPYLDALDRAVGDGLATVAAVSQEQLTVGTEFAERCGVRLPILDDSGLSASTSLDIQNVPTTVLVDAEGTVQDVVIGLDKEGLNRIATSLAQWTNQPATVVAPEEDGNPAWQPG